MAKVHFTEFLTKTGQVIRYGSCQSGHIPKPRQGNAIAILKSHGRRHHIINDGFDHEGKPINARLVEKVLNEREKREPRRQIKIVESEHKTNG